MTLEGAPLVRLAIESRKLDIDSPKPLAAKILAKLTLPNGVALPPSFRELLAYDASWSESLGWFSLSDDALEWTPRSLAQIVRDEGFEDVAEMFEAPKFDSCLLLPGGADSRRVLVITDSPDVLGEIPVALVDNDDTPFLCIYMAGLDVFLGDLTEVQPSPEGESSTYEDTSRDERFRARMSHHGLKLMKGKISTEFPADTLVPRKARTGKNPFTGQNLTIPEIPASEIPVDWNADSDD